LTTTARGGLCVFDINASKTFFTAELLKDAEKSTNTSAGIYRRINNAALLKQKGFTCLPYNPVTTVQVLVGAECFFLHIPDGMKKREG